MCLVDQGSGRTMNTIKVSISLPTSEPPCFFWSKTVSGILSEGRQWVTAVQHNLETAALRLL
jgi:hypothetical protein